MSEIKLDNGAEVVETIKNEKPARMARTHDVLVEHSCFSGAEITEENIDKNSNHVINCWYNNEPEKF